MNHHLCWSPWTKDSSRLFSGRRDVYVRTALGSTEDEKWIWKVFTDGEVWWCNSKGKQFFFSKNDAMIHVDRLIECFGDRLLTQEQWDKFMVLI